MIMKWFQNLGLRSKIVLLVSVLVVFTGIIGVYAVINMNNITENTVTLGENTVPKITHVGRLRAELGDLNMVVLRHMLCDEEAEYSEIEAELQHHKQEAEESFEALRNLLVADSDQEIYNSMVMQWEQFLNLIDNIVALSGIGVSSGIVETYRSHAVEAGDNMARDLDKLAASIEAETNEVIGQSLATAVSGRTAVIVVLIGLIIAGFGVGLFIARDIANPMRELVRITAKIASGDLTEDVQATSSDEVGRLMQTFGDMLKNLRNVIGEATASALAVAGTSEELAASAEQSSSAALEISSTMGQMSAGVEEQTASTNETAASVHQLNEAINQVARGAEAQVQSVHHASVVLNDMKKSMDEAIEALQQVNSASKQSAGSAAKGSQSIENVIASMKHIKEAADTVALTIGELDTYSQDIGRILEVIDDIAEQTNLLALNAAIEAARAGEHGRGFAVVADEVRRLAERSSVETKAIAELITRVRQASDKAVKAITGAGEQVETGNTLTAEAKTVLDEIVQNAIDAETLLTNLIESVEGLEKAGKKVEKSIDEIVSISEENTAATEEMSASAGEVKQAIDNIASISEETAASVEEISASTEQVNASIDQIASSAAELANMAAKLTEAVSVFKIS